MRTYSLLFAALVALPLSVCDDFDAVAALASYGVNASNYGNGGQTAILTGQNVSQIVARSDALGCVYSCASLALLFGSVAYPNSTTYNLEEAGYWSAQQSEVEPYCVYQPSSSTDVAIAILLSRLTECPFAIKSGGHAAFANASNIEGGITINLAKLNVIELSADKTYASIGPGNTWYDVYSDLEDYNLTTIGGRVAAIGVGGLTLGGGISFFSGNYGWACDNVYNYEVVTADGLIIDVNYEGSYSDLYYALRGGGNNFGIVTRFDLYTYSQGLMWGGSRVYYINESTPILNAIVEFSNNAPSDPNAALIVAYAYAEGMYLIAVDLEYDLPEANPTIFEDFETIPHITDTTAVQSLSEITLEFNESNPGGYRETYWTATYQVDLDLLQYMVSEYQNQTNTIITAADLEPSFVLQIITTDQLSHMTKYGGNALGLTEAEGPLILLNLAYWWSDPADDEAVLQVCQNIVDNTEAYAKTKGLANEYLYMNYASQYQDVVPSYNTTNHAKLVSIAEKYDPAGVFQRLQPGYFKLNSAPAGSTIS
ncbi:hypothetical protein LTR85_007056 [Meristemomyces frigidus]|nr:hypothetical protein LTR85_007056 [Meristemomyces frigidus]